jgi:hypothetical protein
MVLSVCDVLRSAGPLPASPMARSARTLPAHHPHNAPTERADTVHPRCARVALLACPDAQRSLLQSVPDLTPHPETSGEARSGTAAKRVRADQQGKT